MNKETVAYGDEVCGEKAHSHHEIARSIDVLDHHSLEGAVQHRPQLRVHATVFRVVLVRENSFGDSQVVRDPAVPATLDCLDRLNVTGRSYNVLPSREECASH